MTSQILTILSNECCCGVAACPFAAGTLTLCITCLLRFEQIFVNYTYHYTVRLLSVLTHFLLGKSKSVWFGIIQSHQYVVCWRGRRWGASRAKYESSLKFIHFYGNSINLYKNCFISKTIKCAAIACLRSYLYDYRFVDPFNTHLLCNKI